MIGRLLPIVYYVCILATIAFNHYYSTFDTLNADVDHIEAIALQGFLMGINLLYMMKYIVAHIKCRFLLFSAIFLFIVMLGVYMIASGKVSTFAKFSFSLSFVFPFYFFAEKGNLKHWSFKWFVYIGLTLNLVYYALDYLMMISQNDAFGVYANNLGYTLLLFWPLLLMVDIKKTTIYLILGLYILTLLSFKRGAIICATASVLFILRYVFKEKIFTAKDKRIFRVTLFLCGLAALFCFIEFDVFEKLASRFDSIEKSSRNDIYSYLYQGWVENDYTLGFGHGLGSVNQYLERKMGHNYYAHSDFFQVIFDHGIVGLFFYMLVLLGIYRFYKTFRHSQYGVITVVVLMIVLFKFPISGIYINIDCYGLFVALGIIAGFYMRDRKGLPNTFYK